MPENKVKMSGNDIRKKFLDFFVQKHGHNLVKSSSLIPDNPTVLLTTAGMLQFQDMFLGYEAPPDPPRITTVQKCARAGGKDSDIENVGRTPRHHTFFEMLGNFAFGDYYKDEVIPWAWDFVTSELKLDKDRLWVTIYETDDEARDIWRDKVGVPESRIIRKGKKDNFWGPPGAAGPCGPCSELHFDLGEQYACSDDCSFEKCECDRFVEIWNLVFTELFQDEEGNFSPLEKKNVDTGMGLERITMVVNELASTFETDLLSPILDKISEISGKKYKENQKTDVSLRIITDHARCVSFLIADGLTPGNEGRNYVLRMIMRRALRHGKLLGVELPFLYSMVDTVVENYSDTYPELKENRDRIVSVIKKEEEKFSQTITRGQTLLDELVQKVKSAGESVINGEDAFKLYDTYGFPLELTIEMAEEQGVKVDTEGFKKAMQEQRERAKAAHVKINIADEIVYADVLKKHGGTEFAGYDSFKSDDSVVSALVKDNKSVDSIEEGDIADIILNKTPFYAESGGQVGDTGIICSDKFNAEVENTLKFDTLIIHKVRVLSGEISVADKVKAEVCEDVRKETTIHHTSAHLLQSALRKVLGDDVAQAGSQVGPDRARFDFSFERALTPQEITEVENLINEWIRQNICRQTKEMTIEEATAAGAIALFGEKYGDSVRVVSIGEVSKELCGGTHAESTGELRLCKIVSEGAIASGTRRIEVLCGRQALEYLNRQALEFGKITKFLKTSEAETLQRIEKMSEEIRSLQKRLKLAEVDAAEGKIAALFDKAEDKAEGKVLVARVDGLAMDILKSSVEKIADKLGESVVVLASSADDKVSIVAKVSQNFLSKGLNAGQIVNEIASACDGKGGGRPNFAQAGAKDASKLDEALNSFKSKLA